MEECCFVNKEVSTNQRRDDCYPSHIIEPTPYLSDSHLFCQPECRLVGRARVVQCELMSRGRLVFDTTVTIRKDRLKRRKMCHFGFLFV